MNYKDNLTKLERYCAYQERSYREVREKLRSLKVFGHEAEEIVTKLINDNYLNEERFARAFARGKHSIRKWGHERIVRELKQHGVSSANIRSALTEIDEATYSATFNAIASKKWTSLAPYSGLQKRKKCCDYLLYKGYESDLVYRKVRELEMLDISPD